LPPARAAPPAEQQKKAGFPWLWLLLGLLLLLCLLLCCCLFCCKKKKTIETIPPSYKAQIDQENPDKHFVLPVKHHEDRLIEEEI